MSTNRGPISPAQEIELSAIQTELVSCILRRTVLRDTTDFTDWKEYLGKYTIIDFDVNFFFERSVGYPTGYITPLTLAAALGDVGMVQWLLANNADPNLASSIGLPLLFALDNWVRYSDLPRMKESCERFKMIIEELLKSGADPQKIKAADLSYDADHDRSENPAIALLKKLQQEIAKERSALAPAITPKRHRINGGLRAAR